MLNLDKIMLETTEVEFMGKIIHMKQPSVLIWERINEAEKDLSAENFLEKRAKVTKILLDNNEEGKMFDIEDVKKLSRRPWIRLLQQLLHPVLRRIMTQINHSQCSAGIPAGFRRKILPSGRLGKELHDTDR